MTELGDVRMAKMEVGLAVLQEQLTNVKRDTNQILNSQVLTNTRLRQLEIWQNRVIGGMAALFSVVVVLTPFAVFGMAKLWEG